MNQPSPVSNLRASSIFDNVRMWLLFLASVILLGGVYMGQFSQATVIGHRIEDKRDRLERISQENAQLQAEIAFLRSPERIETRARALGLKPARPEQFKYVVVKDYPAEPARPPQVLEPSSPNDAGSFDLSAWIHSILARFSLGEDSNAAEATTSP